MHALANVNVNLLVALDALLAERSVRLAAVRMGVTQSAMSHSLQQIRALLGDPVLVRQGNRMLPTPRAERLAGPLRAALQELNRVVASESEFEPATAVRTFRLAMSDAVVIHVVPALVRRMTEEAPGVDLDVVDLRGPHAVDALASGEVDAYVGSPLGGGNAICEERWVDLDFVVVCRADHPRVGETLDLDTFCDLPHVLVGVPGTGRSFVDRRLDELGRSRRVAVRVHSFLAPPWLVAGTDLLLLVPRHAAEVFQQRLPLRIVEPPLQLRAGMGVIAWHERFDRDPASRWLRSALRSVTPR